MNPPRRQTRAWHPALRAFIGTALSVTLLGGVVAAGAALIVVPKATGAKPLTVVTGSMSPTYDPGDVVVVKPTPTEQLQIGDVITYQIRSGEAAVTTHRIVKVVFAADGSRRFVLRGDANGADDPKPIQAVQIRGEVWYSVPWVGYLATAVSSDTRTRASQVTAFGLLLWGGVMVGTGARDRRRRPPAPA